VDSMLADVLLNELDLVSLVVAVDVELSNSVSTMTFDNAVLNEERREFHIGLVAILLIVATPLLRVLLSHLVNIE